MRSNNRLAGTLCCTALLVLPSLLIAHEGPHGEGEGQEPMTITSVVAGGPAEAAGLRVGDRLTSMAGREITTLGDLEQVMGQHRPGDVVPLVVAREGEPVALELTFGERDGGRTSLGVSLSVMQSEAIAPAASTAESPSAGDRSVGDRLGKQECLNWLDETYQLERTTARFGLESTDRLAELRTCIEYDLDRMALPIPFGWCDNVFKVHCSGLDLLTELGEAQITFCEESLAESLGIEPTKEAAWTTCGADRVYDRYSRNGQTSDAAACRQAFEDCAEGR